jgi:hypothetical protein
LAWPRLLRNAIDRPSGDHDGDESSVLPLVIILCVFDTTSNTPTCE